MPYDKLDVAVDVLADMMQHSLIDQVEIDKERTVVQQEIKRGYDQPGAWAGRLLSQACFGDEPLGWSVAGSEETVGEMTRAGLHGPHLHVVRAGEHGAERGRQHDARDA